MSTNVVLGQRNAAHVAQAGEERQRKEAERQRADAQAQGAVAEKNFLSALETVDSLLMSVANSPDLDVDSLQPLRKDLFDQALSYYQLLTERHGDNPDLMFRIAIEYFEFGLAADERGYASDAVDANNKANEILTRLVDQQPTRTDFRHRLAQSQYRSAKHSEEKGEIQLATETSNRSVAILTELLAESIGSSDNHRFQRDLSRCFALLGKIERDSGRYDEAKGFFDRETSLLIRMIKQQPDELFYRKQLADAYVHQAQLSRSQGELEEVAALYHEAEGQYLALVRQDPDYDAASSSLALVYNNLALIEVDQENYEKALEFFATSGELKKQVLDRNPTVHVYARKLASHHARVGVIQRRLGKPDEALASLEMSIQILRELVAHHPEYRTHLAASLGDLSMSLFDLGRYHQSDAANQESLELYRNAQPQTEESQYGVVCNLESLAWWTAQSGNSDTAASHLKEALSTLHELSESSTSRKSLYLGRLSWIYLQLAELSLDRNERQEAFVSHTKAIDVLLDAPADAFDSNQQSFNEARVGMARTRYLNGQTEDTRKLCRSVVDSVEAIDEIERDYTDWLVLGKAQYFLGEFAGALKSLSSCIERTNKTEPACGELPAWWYKTMTLHQLGEKEKAKDYFEQLSRLLDENFGGYDYCHYRSQAEVALGLKKPDN